MTIFKRGQWPALTLSILLVVLLRLSTPVGRPINDGLEYLKVASAGLDPQAQLAAPFAYRFAVPLLVHGASVLTGADPKGIFPYVAILSCIALLIAGYTVARLAGAPRGYALVTMVLIACSLFMIRFPLYFPYAVDVEALVVSFLAFVLLLHRSYVAGLIVSLIGLLFKEFLLVPLIVLAGLSFMHYLRDHTTRPLVLSVLSLLLMSLAFLLPRLLIPVTYSYGTILQVKASAPNSTMYLSELRRFISWPPEIGTAVNVLLALASLWLPVLMLLTPARLRSLWHRLDANRALVVIWMCAVVALTAVGGTNIMIFVTYTAPVLALALGLLLRHEVSTWEIAVAVIGTLLFNRMIFSFGMPGGELDGPTAFYGAYWHQLNEVTAWRFAEILGWILAGWGGRWLEARMMARPVKP